MDKFYEKFFCSNGTVFGQMHETNDRDYYRNNRSDEMNYYINYERNDRMNYDINYERNYRRDYDINYDRSFRTDETNRERNFETNEKNNEKNETKETNKEINEINDEINEIINEIKETNNKRKKDRKKAELKPKKSNEMSGKYYKYKKTNEKKQKERIPKKEINFDSEEFKKFDNSVNIERILFPSKEEINNFPSYKEQLEFCLDELSEVKFEGKSKEVKLFKILFNDSTRTTEHIIYNIKKEKQDPNHSNVLGRRRSINDNIIEELIEETSSKDMTLDDFRIKLNKNNINVDLKQTYQISTHIPSIDTKNVPSIDHLRYDVKVEDLNEYIKRTNTLFKNKIWSSFVYNLDEVGFDSFVDNKKGTVIHNNNNSNKSFYPLKRSNERITLLAIICMDGTEVCPYPIIVPKTTINIEIASEFSSFFYPEYQENGFMTNTIFYNWFLKFIEFNNKKKKEKGYKGKTVIIMDNFGSHKQDIIQQLCKKNNIELLWLVPHSSHLTQPLDLVIFHAMKNKMKKRNMFLDLLRENEKSKNYDKNIIINDNKELLEKNDYKINKTNSCDKLDRRIKIIIECWRKTCVKYSKSAFRQAGFYTKPCYKNQQQASDYVKNNKITKVHDIDLLVPIAKFHWTLCRELKPILDPKNEVAKIEIENEERVNIEEDEERERRLQKTRKRNKK